MQILSRDGMGSDFTIQIPFSFLFNVSILLSILLSILFKKGEH